MKQQHEPKTTQVIKALLRAGFVVVKSHTFPAKIEPIIKQPRRNAAIGGVQNGV